VPFIGKWFALKRFSYSTQVPLTKTKICYPMSSTSRYTLHISTIHVPIATILENTQKRFSWPQTLSRSPKKKLLIGWWSSCCRSDPSKTTSILFGASNFLRQEGTIRAVESNNTSYLNTTQLQKKIFYPGKALKHLPLMGYNQLTRDKLYRYSVEYTFTNKILIIM